MNALLETEPRSIPGHVAKADCRARAGDDDLAIYFYRAALRLAEGERLSPDVMKELARARQALARLEDRAHAVREARLIGRGAPPGSWSDRFRHSLELAAGKRRLYAQQPTAFHFPGLPTVQFYDPRRFGWTSAIEAATPAIREELLGLLEQPDAFRPYVQSTVGAIPLEANKALLNRRDWSVLSLCQNGWVAPDIVARCPRTWEAVLQAPLPRIAGWGPTVTFSMLKAGVHIERHTGMVNTRLICHLPLIVPPGCRFRVGDEICEWEEGKLLIFDDSIEHEAWNDGPEDRVVLIFDIWRPELTEQERRELTLLFSD